MLLNKISKSCPISTKRIDGNMVRVISFQVATFTMILLLTKERFFAFVLLFDFLMRVLGIYKLSPFYLIGQVVLTDLGIVPRFCDESPKRFALYLGLIISLVLVVTYRLDFEFIATFIAVVLLVCALLEALLDFCIGCKIYYVIELIKGVFRDDRNIQ